MSKQLFMKLHYYYVPVNKFDQKNPLNYIYMQNCKIAKLQNYMLLAN